MNVTLYRLLNNSAKAWWYHAKLRREGDCKEARKRERQSILSDCAALRQAYYWSVGRGGFSVHCRRHENATYTVSHCSGIDAPLIQACIMRGIPGHDSNPVTDFRALLRAPMVSDRPDKPREGDKPYGSFSFAPVEYVQSYYGSIGATLYHATT